MALMRGTTPTHVFKTSISLVDAVVCYITYKQQHVTVLEKTLDDAAITDEQIAVTLTQQDTLAFRADVPVEIQIRARFADSAAVACNIITTTTDRILKEGVI